MKAEAWSDTEIRQGEGLRNDKNEVTCLCGNNGLYVFTLVDVLPLRTKAQ